MAGRPPDDAPPRPHRRHLGRAIPPVAAGWQRPNATTRRPAAHESHSLSSRHSTAGAVSHCAPARAVNRRVQSANPRPSGWRGRRSNAVHATGAVELNHDGNRAGRRDMLMRTVRRPAGGPAAPRGKAEHAWSSPAAVLTAPSYRPTVDPMANPAHDERWRSYVDSMSLGCCRVDSRTVIASQR